MINLKFERLDLGCGSFKPDGYIGVDLKAFDYPEGEFFLADLKKRLPFDDCSFIEIRALQVIEHLDNSKKVDFMREIFRLLKPKGLFYAEFPPPICKNGAPNPNFFIDPTHTAWWMIGTFFCFDKGWREADINKDVYVKGYEIDTDFLILGSGWIDEFNCFITMTKLRSEK